MSDSGLRQRLAAILAADVAGYSRLMAADDRGTVAALDAARRVFKAHIEASQGRVIDMVGDSVLAVFETAKGAVAAALAIQQEFGAIPSTVPEDRRMRFRIGVHLGDVIEKDDGTIYGDGVNIAARLEGLAESGGLTISDSVHNAVRGKVAASFVDQGEQQVKNIPHPVRAFAVRAAGDAVANPVPASVDVDLSVPDKPSIAVLPFANMSGDPEQEYFTDGITEDIITEISRITGLFVIARNSTFTYKGKATKVQDVCRDLGVRFVLEGSVRKSGQRIRVTAQLIDGASGGHIWAERYDRELADIFAVQDDVTGHIVRSLEGKLIGARPALSSRMETDKPEAYDCVLRGREKFRLYTKDGNIAAQRLYQRAIELDARYAEAYAGLALTFLHDWFLGSPDALDQSFELAQTAKSIDPGLPLVYEALGSVHLFKLRHDDAIAAASRWIEIEPGNAEAYANLAGILQFAGEPERVAGLIEKAKRLNPFYPFYYNLYIGQACFTMRRFADAVPIIARSIVHNPESLPAHFYLAACYSQMGEDVLARDALIEVRRISPDFSIGRLRGIAAYRRAADLELIVEGLRTAGLRE